MAAPKKRFHQRKRKNRVGFFGLRNSAHMAGVNVSALKPENAVLTAIVRANCLYSCPVMPLTMAVGTNTASSTSTSPITGPCSSCMALRAACRGDSLPPSSRREQSSTTTMASSTTMAMASTRPKSDRVLSENPIHFITARVAMSDTGMVSMGMITARQFWRNIIITSITSRVVSRKVISSSSIEAVT